MSPENFNSLGLADVYIVNSDERVLLGQIAPLEIHIDLANEDDKTVHTLMRSYEGTFKIKAISKGILRQLTDKYYCKYLKRVNNRNKLYEKRRAKYGK